MNLSLAASSRRRVGAFRRTHMSRILRFGIVGGSGTLVNMGILALLAGGLGVHHMLAAIVSAEVSIITNFVLNDRWTFRDRRPSSHWLQRILRYNLFALGGMAISLLILAVLTYGWHLHYLVATAVAIVAVMAWNYIANSRWTWTLPSVESTNRYGDVQ